jgi:23S rRNA pseudouridine2605 synthase
VKLKVLRDQLGKGLAELANVDFAASVRETPSAKEQQERREQAQNRPRKHVSALRKQREEIAEKGPRARIERAITADRKGRAVAVERVIVKGATPLADSRNARRFDKLRRDGAEGDEKAKAPREGGGFKSARPSRAEGGARFERKDARPPRERKFEGGEGPARGPRPPRAEAGKPPRARFTPREGAASREARAPRAEGAGRFERTDARPSRAGAPRERAEYKGARAPRENAPRERNFERGEGPARGPRPPRAEGGAKAPRARAFAPREGADFKSARPARGKEQAGGPRPSRDANAKPPRGDSARPPRGESARPSRDASARPPRGDGGKKFDGPRKPGGSGGKPRDPGGSGKPPKSSGPRGPRGPR